MHVTISNAIPLVTSTTIMSMRQFWWWRSASKSVNWFSTTICNKFYPQIIQIQCTNSTTSINASL